MLTQEFVTTVYFEPFKMEIDLLEVKGPCLMEIVGGGVNVFKLTGEGDVKELGEK